MPFRRTSFTVIAILAVASCGSDDNAARTKNLTIGTSPRPGERSINIATTVVTIDKFSPTTEPSPFAQAPLDESECSPLGAIHRSNPVIVAPPEPNSAEQSYSSGPCSFYETYKSFPGIGRYEFIWDAASTPKAVSGRPVVVEVSRDGVLWTALATDWSSKKPHSAVAYLTMSGNLRVRVRPS